MKKNRSKLIGIKSFFPYFFQSFLAAGAISLSLIFFNVFKQSAIIVSLGATTYLMFTKPHAVYSNEKHIFGGYFIAIFIGILMSQLCKLHFFLLIFPDSVHILFFAGLAVGLTIFFSTILNTEHPPSGGMALALVLNEWDGQTIFLIIISLMLLFTIKKLLNPILKDIF